MMLWKKKRLNKLLVSLWASDIDATRYTKITLEVGCRFSDNDMRITDTIENLGEMFTMLYDTLDLSREEFKKGKDGGIIVVLFSIDDCLTFELKKTIAYKAYLEKRISQEKI